MHAAITQINLQSVRQNSVPAAIRKTLAVRQKAASLMRQSVQRRNVQAVIKRTAVTRRLITNAKAVTAHQLRILAAKETK